MTDIFTKEKRSEIMSKIRSLDTTPELKIRTLLKKHRAKFVTHPTNVIGKPDIANPEKKLAVFIDGCFWHGCKICRTIPKANKNFWEKKISYNKKRRRTVKRELKRNGWNVMEFWEHEVNKHPEKVVSSIMQKLKG